MSDFSAASAGRVLIQACEMIGVNAEGAELLRLGENAIFSLAAEPIIVRIARSVHALNDVHKEVRVARWLREADFPAARLADVGRSGDLIVVDGRPVTFWERIDSSDEPPTPGDLGRLLQRLHNLERPDWLRLPEFSPFARVDRRLTAAEPGVDPDDIAYLRALLEDLHGQYAALKFDFPYTAVHGDAHPRNLLRSVTGEAILIDFEAFSYGPREWDLSLAASYRYAFNWFTADEYRAYVEAYGYDVSDWAGCSTFRAMRELGMTSWLMQLVDDPARAEEFRRRIDDMRSERFPRRWKAF